MICFSMFPASNFQEAPQKCLLAPRGICYIFKPRPSRPRWLRTERQAQVGSIAACIGEDFSLSVQFSSW